MKAIRMATAAGKITALASAKQAITNTTRMKVITFGGIRVRSLDERLVTTA